MRLKVLISNMSNLVVLTRSSYHQYYGILNLVVYINLNNLGKRVLQFLNRDDRSVHKEQQPLADNILLDIVQNDYFHIYSPGINGSLGFF